ncbi:MAG: FAD-dependent oxidoreductase [Candidatus Latescibacteria bacterium]|nr:FAD-dependent oxidoreductase [Candidatus Latescibacterota bacterium]NIM64999.1 FAD-dependent oxidoreductase [Candidatus Latescibacterota bacterium]NIO01514.1 FAD-dependent oxidoreductase [Candidatus Latescibacterota bacterium]NIO28023.1 FAD-dependent oxidoreductase [Candidatus Latescibacterota bacterium]NIO55575.1 FAD-dependent oxidoreductase [Candidatus Latescibacterota bacterium]
MSRNMSGARFRAEFRDFAWYRRNVPCMEACPVHTDSGKYVQLIANEEDSAAYLVARSANPLASICGRICAAPCEDACRRNWIDGAVTIRPLKRFVTEQFGVESSSPETFRSLLEGAKDPGCSRLGHLPQLAALQNVGRGKRVAVIGSGPAGLGCAHDLSLMGYSVTVFESQQQAGGMLRYGIPEFRLPRGVIEREVASIEQLGATFRFGTPLTHTYNLRSLRNEGFEAVFLAVGAMRGRELDIPGHDIDGVVKAVDYLLNLNHGYRTELGDKVVVIGGGSVALDAARSVVRDFYEPMEEIQLTAEAAANQPALDAARGALRGGASEVHVVSLESMEELPAARTVQGMEELREAGNEGIQFHPSWGPKKILGEGRVTGVDLVACTQVFDEHGRFNPAFDESKTFHLDADSIILAIGQQPDLTFLSDDDGIELTNVGTLKINPETLATTAPGIFAGGDAAFGPRIAIEGVANGKLAARSIHEYLSGEKNGISFEVEIHKIANDDYSMLPGYEKRNRIPPPATDTGRRTGITEVEEILGEEQARDQAGRCLLCHVDTIYDPLKCVLCGRCADICPENCLIFVPMDDVDMPEDQQIAALERYHHDESLPMTVLLKDDTKCIRCGLCARRCPTEAMTMERFSIAEKSS